MLHEKFLLSAEESELLLAFEKMGNIEATARALRKDASGVSRQLSAIAKKCSALEKRNGRWMITEIGRAFNSLARNVIQAQHGLMESRPSLVIGTNREFGSRVIGPDFLSLQKALPNTQLSIFTFENGTEEALLKGKVDIGFDCGRPFDPAIAYKLLVPEPIVIVSTRAFLRKYRKEISEKRLYRVPHLLCDRLSPDKIFSERENKIHIKATFNDIATARAACLAGAGWSLLPRYSVEKELQEGTLEIIEARKSGEAHYGLWWPRMRQFPPDIFSALFCWLKKQKI
jgi:DNA-binding transcriptional LysR family regulator